MDAKLFVTKEAFSIVAKKIANTQDATEIMAHVSKLDADYMGLALVLGRLHEEAAEEWLNEHFRLIRLQALSTAERTRRASETKLKKEDPKNESSIPISSVQFSNN